MKKTISIALAAVMICSMALTVSAAISEQPGMVSGMIDAVNEIRRDAGLNELTLDADLQEAAQLRAVELAEYYSPDHYRPNGQMCFTASTKIWYENIAYSYDNKYEAMQAWIDSPGHLANIKQESTTIAGFGCAIGDGGTPYWVQVFGTGTSNFKWAMTEEYGSAKSFTLDPFNDPNTPRDSAGATTRTATTTVFADGTVGTDSGWAVTGGGAAETASATTGGLLGDLEAAMAATPSGTVVVKEKNLPDLTAQEIKDFISKAGGRAVRVYADTIQPDSKAVMGRIVVDPAKFAALDTTIQLRASTLADEIATVKSAASKAYSNKMAYIHLSQPDKFAATVDVMAKVDDLTGMDATKLVLYSYNSATKAVTEIKTPNYKINANGYLHFQTALAADIIVSEGALVAK